MYATDTEKHILLSQLDAKLARKFLASKWQTDIKGGIKITFWHRLRIWFSETSKNLIVR